MSKSQQPKKAQASLTSFFAAGSGGPKKPKGPKQSRIELFTKKKDETEREENAKKEKGTKESEEKENVENASPVDEPAAEVEPKPPTKKKRSNAGMAKAKAKAKTKAAPQSSPKRSDDADDLMDTDDDGGEDGAPLASLGNNPEVDRRNAKKANARNARREMKERLKKGRKSRLDDDDGGKGCDGEDESSDEGVDAKESKDESPRKRRRLGKKLGGKSKSKDGVEAVDEAKKQADDGEGENEDEDSEPEKGGDEDDEEEEFEPEENDGEEDDDDEEMADAGLEEEEKHKKAKKAEKSKKAEKGSEKVESDSKNEEGNEEETASAKHKFDNSAADEDMAGSDDEDSSSEAEEEDGEKKPAASKKKSVNEALKRKPVANKSKGSSNNNKKSEDYASSMPSDEDLLKQNAEAKWKDGAPVPYASLCATFSEIEAISGRLEIQSRLTALLRLALLKSPEDLLGLAYLASNSVAPAYECIELGVGDSILIKAIGEACGTKPAMIKQKYEKEGDLGTVASSAKGKQRTLGFGIKPKPLMAKEVLGAFRQIATTTGSQSQKWKVDKIKGLLVRAQSGSEEAKYIIRGLQGKLRIGLAQSTVLVSLAHALALSPPEEVRSAKVEDGDNETTEDGKRVSNPKLPLDERLEAAANIVKKAYSEVPSYERLVDAGLSHPLSALHRACRLQPGVPVSPMLAKPTKSIQEVLKRLNGQRFTCEYKYDGERAQVHMTSEGGGVDGGTKTKVFSRNLLDTTEKFPEVPLYVKEACEQSGVKSFVLDTEVVAWNNETKQFVPFQVLSTRKKTEESAETAKVSVIVQAFDLMYLNGVSLLDKTLSERRDLLRKNFAPVEGKFQFATSLDHTEDGDTTVLEEFLDAAVKGQCEGLMVKTLDSNAAYEPSRRSFNWLKLKKDYLEGLGDSVDLVPLGAYHGRGKRTGVYGAYLLGCYDPDSEEFQSVCKIGTGFSDEDLKSLAEEMNAHRIPAKTSQYNVSDTLEPDVWFDAAEVWEVKAADLSKSSTHKGAIDKTGEAGRGIGLRFPRFERVRPDKKPEQATTSDQILDMYYAQDSVVNDGGMGVGGGFDDDGI